MAIKKDNAVVAVISDVSVEQAAQITKDIIKAKKKYAPNGRGTVACCPKASIGGLLQKENRKICGKRG